MSPPWQYLQGAAGNSTTANTSASATFGSNVSAGSKIIVLIVTSSVTATPDAPTSGAFTWTAAGATLSGTPNGALTLSMFFLDTPASLVGTKPTITSVLNASSTWSMSIIEVAGLLAGNTTACLDGVQATKLITGAASLTQPAYTSHYPGEFLAVGYGDNGGPSIYTCPTSPAYSADNNTGSGIVNGGVNDNTSNNSVIAYKASTGGAEGTPTWTFGGTPTSQGSGFIVVAFQIAWSSPTRSLNFSPGQQFPPLARQFGPVPPFALLQAEGQAPAAAPVITAIYGALRSPVAPGFPTDSGPNSASAGNGATLPRRGQIKSSPGVYNQVGPPFKSDSSPVAQGSSSAASSSANQAQLPRRGRTYGVSHSGIFDQTGPPVYPLRSPVATGTTISPSSRNGATLPARGRTRSSSGVYNQVGAPVYPLHSPVAQGGTSAAVSRNGAALPPRGRTSSNPGVRNQLGPTVTPQQRAVRAKVAPLPPFGRTATMVPLVTTVTPVAAIAPFYPQGLIAPKSRGFAPRGRTRSGIGVSAQVGPVVKPLQHPVRGQLAPQPPYGRTATMVPLVTTSFPVGAPATFYPLNHPVQPRIPRPTWRGACRTMSVLVVTIPPVTSGPPFTPQGLIAGKSRGFPPRGRAQTRAGTFQQTGPAVAPLQQPAGTRVIGVRTGSAQAFTSAIQLLGPPVYPLQRPVTAKVRVLPPRGRNLSLPGTYQGTGAPLTQLRRPIQARIPLAPHGRAAGRAGKFTAVAVTPATFYPLNHPAQARFLPPTPPFGRTATMVPLTYVPSAAAPAAFYPLNRPVSAIIRPLSIRGRTTSRNGTFQQIGPAVTPQQRALRARLPQQPFLKGRVSSNAGIRAQLGPPVTPLQRPVAARTRPLPPRGTAQGRAGVFTQVTQAGPPVYPLRHPVAAVIRPLPSRGRTAGRAGVFQGSGPAVKPLQHPVYAWRPGPRRGVSLTSVRPPAAAGTGSKFYPLRKPVQGRQPLPSRGQRWTAGPYVPPFVPAGGHGYPYHARLLPARWYGFLADGEWSGMTGPVRYSAISVDARWPSALEAGRWFTTCGPA